MRWWPPEFAISTILGLRFATGAYARALFTKKRHLEMVRAEGRQGPRQGASKSPR